MQSRLSKPNIAKELMARDANIRVEQYRNALSVTTIKRSHSLKFSSSETTIELILPPSDRPFHSFFQLLTQTSSAKSVDTTGKSALKLVKFSNLIVIRLKRAKIQRPQIHEILQTFLWWPAWQAFEREGEGNQGARPRAPKFPLPLPLLTPATQAICMVAGLLRWGANTCPPTNKRL